jgi:hypothetical protein
MVSKVKSECKKLSLACFAARIALVDAVKDSAAADEDITRLLLLYGCPYLHRDSIVVVNNLA